MSTKTEISPVIRAFTAIDWKLASWAEHNRVARAKVADPTMSISSFVLDELIVAGSREEMTRYLTRVRDTLSSYLTYEAEDTLKRYPSGVDKDEAEAIEYIRERVESLTEQFMDWYKPNSTSNSHVELELHKHTAIKEALAALKGRSY